jgi:hypothetical protein
MKINNLITTFVLLFTSGINQFANAGTNETTPTLKRNALYIMNSAFIKNNQKCSTALQLKIASIDTAKYTEFLKSKQKISTPCGADTTAIFTRVASYRNANDYETIAKNLVELKDFVLTSGKNDESYLRCVEQLTSVVDKNGLFIAGLHYGKNFKNENDLKITQAVKGNVLLLTPQILYLWPGNNNSAKYLIMPTEMYTVLAAQTFYPEVTTHCQEWKKTGVEAADYLKLTNKTHLLVDDGKGHKGWVDMDSVAFFDKSFDKALDEGIKKVYINGYSWYLHGVWQERDVYEPENYEDPNSKEVCVANGRVEIVDFYNFIISGAQSIVCNKRDKSFYIDYFPNLYTTTNILKMKIVKRDDMASNLIISYHSNDKSFEDDQYLLWMDNGIVSCNNATKYMKFSTFFSN